VTTRGTLCSIGESQDDISPVPASLAGQLFILGVTQASASKTLPFRTHEGGPVATQVEVELQRNKLISQLQRY